MAVLNDIKGNGHGGRRAGAGRPKGSTLKEKQELIKLAAENSARLVNVVIGIAESQDHPASARLQAIGMLWDRAFGRPRAETEEVAPPTTIQTALADALKEED